MDFHGMKRKELQVLCKKHQIPANLSNREMANRLMEFVKENKEAAAQGLQRYQDEHASEAETTDVVVNRKAKKVRFSPEHELIEFTRSRDLKRRSKRNSVSISSSNLSVENVGSYEISEENVGRPGRVTRARGLKLMEGKENKNKRGRNGVKCHDQKNDVASENLDNNELGVSDVNSPRRVTRLQGKVVLEAAKNKSNWERKRVENDERREQRAQNKTADDNLIKKVVDIPGRVTRFRRSQELMGDALRKEGRGINVVEKNENACTIAEIADDKGVVSRKAKRLKNNSKAGQEVLASQKIAEVHVVVDPPNVLRRSRRNASRIDVSESFNGDTKENDIGGIKVLKETSKLAADGSIMDAESNDDKIDLNARVVEQVEEHKKLDQRKSNRRWEDGKDGIKSQEENGKSNLQLEIKNGYPRRSSRLQSGTAREVSKDDDGKVPQPTEVMRKSRHDSSSLKTTSGKEKLNIDAGAGNVEIKKHSNKPCQAEMENPIIEKNTRRSTRNVSRHRSSETLHGFGGDCILQPENKVRKPEKATTIVEVADRRKQLHELNATSQEAILEAGDSSFVEAPLPVQEVAKSTEEPELTSDTSAKNVTSDVGLKSSQERHSKKRVVTIADGTVPGNVSFAENSPTADNLLLRDQADLKTDLKASVGEEQKDAQPTLDVLDNDVHEASGVSVPKNLESVEMGNVKMISRSYDFQHIGMDPLGASKNSSEGENDDTVLKAREAIAFESCERHSDAVNSKGALQPTEFLSIKLSIIQEDDNTAEGNDTDGVGCIKDCEDSSSEDKVFCVSESFHGDKSTRIIPQDTGISEAEYSVADLDSTEVHLNKGSEEHQVAQCDEICINKTLPSESAKTDLARSSEDHRSDCSEEDGESMFYLFDAERRASTISQDGGTFSASYSTKGPNEQGSSSLQEIDPSKLNNIAQVGADVGTQGKENTICQSNVSGEEMSMAKTIYGGKCEVASQADDQGNEVTYECEEHPNSLLVKLTVADPVQEQEAQSTAIENGYMVSISKTIIKGHSRENFQVSYPNNYANDANWGMDTEDLAGAFATDVSFASTIPKVGVESHSKWECERMEETEYQYQEPSMKHTVLDVGEDTRDRESSQSWTEIDLNNLFGATEDDITFTGLNHTPSQGTEIAHLTMCLKKSTFSSSGSVTKKDTQMEGEEGSESANTTYAGCSVGIEENQLKVLYATPGNVYEISANDRKLDTAMPLKEGPETMIENIVTKMKFDEEMQDTIHEYINGEYVNHAELKIESVELVNTCTSKLPLQVEYDTCEASKEQLTKNACVCSEETESKEVEIMEMINTCTATVTSEGEYKVCETSREQLTENIYECWEENTCTTEVPVETEYKVCAEVSEEQLAENNSDCWEETELSEVVSLELVNTCANEVPKEAECNVCEASDQRLTENACEYSKETEIREVESVELVNTCTAKVPPEAECDLSEASEQQLTENSYKFCEENICSTKVPSEAEYNIYKASKGQLDEYTYECREETKPNEVDTVVLETEYKVCEASVEQLAKNTCEHREDDTFITEIPSEVEHDILGTSDELVVEHTCECRQVTGLNECTSMEVVNACAAEVPQAAEVNVCEASREQFIENACEHREERELNEVGIVELVNVFTAKVAPEIAYDIYETSEEKLSDKTHECQEGMQLNEVEGVDLENSCTTKFSPEDECNACEASEEELTENTSDGREETHSIQENLEEEILTPGHRSQYEEATNNGTGTSSRASHDSDKGTVKDTKLSKENAADGTPRYPHDTFDELHTSNELAIKNILECYTPGVEAVKATSTVEPHSTCKEAKERGIVTQDAIDTVPAAGHESHLCVVQSDDIISSSAMHLLMDGNENGGVSKSDEGIPFANAEPDQVMDAKDVKENSTPIAVQFAASELHWEAGSNVLSSSVHCVSNVPEILKESDVAETIKEYINSESWLAADLLPTDALTRWLAADLLPTDALTHSEIQSFEDAALVKLQHNVNPPVEAECREGKGSADDVKLETQPKDSHRSSPKQLHSTAKKNARTILIHGTPRKQLAAVDMKENMTSYKTSNNGVSTTTRPNRKALQDVKWK